VGVGGAGEVEAGISRHTVLAHRPSISSCTLAAESKPTSSTVISTGHASSYSTVVATGHASSYSTVVATGHASSYSTVVATGYASSYSTVISTTVSAATSILTEHRVTREQTIQVGIAAVIAIVTGLAATVAFDAVPVTGAQTRTVVVLAKDLVRRTDNVDGMHSVVPSAVINCNLHMGVV
jgi:hypothetical protein